KNLAKKSRANVFCQSPSRHFSVVASRRTNHCSAGCGGEMQSIWRTRHNTICSEVNNPAVSEIRIFLVGVETLFLTALSRLLESQPGLTVVGRSISEETFGIATDTPDIILFDPGDEDGLIPLSRLLRVASGARVLVMSGMVDPEVHLRALEIGAAGVVPK